MKRDPDHAKILAWLKESAFGSYKFGEFKYIVHAETGSFWGMGSGSKAVAFASSVDASEFRKAWLSKIEAVWSGWSGDRNVDGSRVEIPPELAFRFQFPRDQESAIRRWAGENCEGAWSIRGVLAIETLEDAVKCRLKFYGLKVVAQPPE